MARVWRMLSQWLRLHRRLWRWGRRAKGRPWLAEEPLLLRMPLVRWQQRLTVGDAEATWQEWTGR